MLTNAAEAALAHIMQRLDLPYEREAAGTAILFIDGLGIGLVPDENRLRFLFKLADLPVDAWAREAMLISALRVAAGNLANMEENRETLTVSENNDEILLFRIVTVDQLDVEQCLDNLAHFVDAAEYWQRAMGLPATLGARP